MLSPFLAAATQVASNQDASGFTAAQSLTTLLTTESLLFAAFNAGVVLTAPAAGGRQITPTNAYRLAKACVLALAAVAVAAGFAWWQVFGDAWPDSHLRALEAIGIAVGITVQPIIGGIIVRSSRPRR